MAVPVRQLPSVVLPVEELEEGDVIPKLILEWMPLPTWAVRAPLVMVRSSNLPLVFYDVFWRARDWCTSYVLY